MFNIRTLTSKGGHSSFFERTTGFSNCSTSHRHTAEQVLVILPNDNPHAILSIQYIHIPHTSKYKKVIFKLHTQRPITSPQKHNQSPFTYLSLHILSLIYILTRSILFQIPKGSQMMSDELHECKSAFSGKKGLLQTNIYLETLQDSQVLVIDLRNEIKMEFFQLKIDHNYLTENSQMRFCFETPEDLFYTLMELFHQVSISEDGVLTFEMKLNASKLKKKVFRLQIERQKIDQNEMLALKFENMRKEFKHLLAVKDQRIAELTKKTVELSNSVEVLKEEVLQMKREGEELSLQYKKKDFKMNSIVKQSELQRQQIAILRKSLEEFHKKFSLLQLYNFFDNPHWHNFSVYRGDQSIIIVKKDSDSVWHSFVRNVPLAQGKTYQFKLRQLKTSYRNIMIGICTRECFGVTYAYKSKCSLSYNSYSGNVWQRGNSRKGGMAITDGQWATIEINLQENKVIWFIENKKATEASIPEEMRNKEVFLSLQFYNIEDEIELMHY